jgi:hypothetical protein
MLSVCLLFLPEQESGQIRDTSSCANQEYRIFFVCIPVIGKYRVIFSQSKQGLLFFGID